MCTSTCGFMIQLDIPFVDGRNSAPLQDFLHQQYVCFGNWLGSSTTTTFSFATFSWGFLCLFASAFLIFWCARGKIFRRQNSKAILHVSKSLVCPYTLSCRRFYFIVVYCTPNMCNPKFIPVVVPGHIVAWNSQCQHGADSCIRNPKFCLEMDVVFSTGMPTSIFIGIRVW